jgi:hypothetical protein
VPVAVPGARWPLASRRVQCCPCLHSTLSAHPSPPASRRAQRPRPPVSRRAPFVPKPSFPASASRGPPLALLSASALFELRLPLLSTFVRCKWPPQLDPRRTVSRSLPALGESRTLPAAFQSPIPYCSRPNAWNNRGSGSFSPGPQAARLANNSSPAPGAAPSPAPGAAPQNSGAGPNGAPARAPDAERILQQLAGLTGTTVTVVTRAGPRWEGVVGGTQPEGDVSGLTLKDARDVNVSGAALKDRVFVPSTDLASWTSGPASSRPANGDCERPPARVARARSVCS